MTRASLSFCVLLPVAIGLLVPACVSGGDDAAADDEAPEVYEYTSRFDPDASSVSYSGQSARQVLIAALKAEIDAVQRELEEGAVFEEGEVLARLLFYYDFDSETSGAIGHPLATEPAPLQSTFDDISTGKDLRSKFAGNDEVGQHADWTTEFIGGSGLGAEGLLLSWFGELDELAVAHSEGDVPTDPDGVQIAQFFVSADGRDLQQLSEKLLLGAINFSQGTDDYLDDDVEGKGLLSDHTEADDDAPYTALEHAWDEGFGYWGGARDYLDYSDDEIAGADGRPEFAGGYHDSDGDGAIDLTAEYNFAASVNAAKRDRGSSSDAPTDFTQTTMEAFLEGRWIIAQADGPLSDDELSDLRAQRDIAVQGWEQALAATAIHYVNDTLKDMNADPYSFADHAKHWSELKGFALSLQFNPRTPLSADDIANLHELVGTAPVHPGDAGAAEYRADLLEARTILGEAYGFDAANLGDEEGEHGW